MKFSSRIGVSSILMCAIALTAGCASQKSAHEAGAADEAEVMARMTAYMTPGPELKVLDTKVGHWTAHMTWWMSPEGPSQESDGAAQIGWVLGGRFLHESFTGTAMGQPFEGLGVTGFDNLKKKFVGAWIDNMSSGMMTSEGTYDAAKKTLTITSSGPDDTMTKLVPVRMVETLGDANKHTLEMFGPDPSGKEYRKMEIVYTRVK